VDLLFDQFICTVNGSQARWSVWMDLGTVPILCVAKCRWHVMTG